MNGFFKSFKFKIIICIAAFFLGVGLYSVSKGGEASIVSQVIGVTLNPIKKYTNAISDKISLVIDLLVDSEVYVEENKKLREQIGELNKRLIDYEDIKAENEDLRKFIGIKEQNEDIQVSHPCTIISRTTNDPYGTFTIGITSADKDIKLYDPVVTSEGIVGVITELADSYATVRTILSPDLSIGGLCIESRDTGIIEGSLSYAADGKCKMIYLDKSNKIKVGDLIVTSGNSGQFPQGYIIGNVTETGIEESGLTAYAVIEPAVNPKDITSVMVMTDFNKEEKDNEIPTGTIGEKATEASTEASTETTDATNTQNGDDADDNDLSDGDIPEATDPTEEETDSEGGEE